MPWVCGRASGLGFGLLTRTEDGEQSSRGPTGRFGLLCFLPRASASGLSPGLGSPGPLGRF